MKRLLFVLAAKRVDPLCEVLASLLAVERFGWDIHVWVDGAEDGVVDVIKSFPFPYTLNPPTGGSIGSNIYRALNTAFFRWGYQFVGVLEDDLVVLPSFFSYLTFCSSHFLMDNQVVTVSTYNWLHHPPKEGLDNKVFLRRYFSSWGWGTWKHKWKMFGNLYRLYPVPAYYVMKRLNRQLARYEAYPALALCNPIGLRSSLRKDCRRPLWWFRVDHKSPLVNEHRIPVSDWEVHRGCLYDYASV